MARDAMAEDGPEGEAPILFEDECKVAVTAAAAWTGEYSGPYCRVRAADYLVTSTECMFLYALSSSSLSEALRPTMTPESLRNLEKFVRIEAPVCAICRRSIDELCPECALADVDMEVSTVRRRMERKRQLVSRAWGAQACVSSQGACRHIYHEHCIESWIYSRTDPETARTYGYSKHNSILSAARAQTCTSCPMCARPWRPIATLARQPPSCPQDLRYKRKRPSADNAAGRASGEIKKPSAISPPLAASGDVAMGGPDDHTERRETPAQHYCAAAAEDDLAEGHVAGAAARTAEPAEPR